MNNEDVLYELVKSGVWVINTKGEILNRKGERVEKKTPQGYLQVRKMTKGVRLHSGAHRLVYLHFKGKIPPGMTINHLNGIKTDNRPENLEIATHSENMKHAFRVGLKSQYGQKNPNCKLTDTQIMEIREVYAKGQTTQMNLAEKYGIAFQTVSKIVRGVSRVNLPGKTADYTNRRTKNTRQRNAKGQFI